MLSKFLQWFDERWPFKAVIRYTLEEEIPGGDSFWYCFGALTLFVFVLQVLTGIWQLFFYVPTVDHAYQSVSYIRQQVPFGWFIHGLHYWGSNVFIVLAVIHILRVFVWGAYKYPRQLTWLAGVLLFFLVMALSFTGALLPWDELGYWAAEVGTSIAGTVPLIGFYVKEFLRGGPEMDQAALSRFFVLHVAILPAILGGLIAFHVVAFRQFKSVGPWNPEKSKKIGYFWPGQVLRDMIAVSLLFIIVVALIAFWRAPITGPADPIDDSITPKPEWQFLFLYQFLKLFKGPWEPVGTVGVPLLLFLILFLLPFYDRNKQRNPLRRPLAMIGCFALIVWVAVYTILGYRSNPGANLTAPVTVSSQASVFEKAGAKLFSSQGCLACHTIGGQGGDVGPNLSSEGAKGRSDDWLSKQIRDPKAHNPSTAMPAFDSLSDKQVNNLVNFLQSQGNNSNKSAGPSNAEKSSQTPGSLPQPSQEPKSADGKTSIPDANSIDQESMTEPNDPPESDESPVSSKTDFSKIGPAAYFVGNPSHGQTLFKKQCQRCHGKDAKGGVPNPGSDDGTVPPLNSIDPSLSSPNPVTFAENIDRYMQHGSIPDGPHPEKTMPAFGDDLTLTQPMIAQIQAYILKLNNVDRAMILHPGVKPDVFFAITILVYAAAGLVIVFLGFYSKGGRLKPIRTASGTSHGKQGSADSGLQAQAETSTPPPEKETDEDQNEYEQMSPESQDARKQRLNSIYFALFVITLIVIIATCVLLVFSSFVTTKPVPSVTTLKITSTQSDTEVSADDTNLSSDETSADANIKNAEEK